MTGFIADDDVLKALTSIVKQSGATVVGCGIAIEKGMQPGGSLIREMGYRVESVAIIDEMDCRTNTIRFRPQ